MNHALKDIEVTTIDGQTVTVGSLLGKATVVVNVASKCGLTPQYEGLEDLYRRYKDKGLVVLGCPCDQFRHQEPGTEDEIQSFCSLNYGVSFPLTAKLDVNGPGAHPLFQHLKHKAPGVWGSEGVKWNFTKFLLNGQGEVIARFAPITKPAKLEAAVVELLGA